MNSEQIEFLISQQVDGTITSAGREVLQSHLAANPGDWRLVEEYASLEAVLKSASPVPEIDHRALTARINDAIDEANAAPSYRLPFSWGAIGSGLAIAACAAIAVGVWVRPFGASKLPVVASSVSGHHVIEVAVLQPADAKLEFGPGLQRITVGPPADGSGSAVISEAMVERPNTLFIAKADQPAQDTSQPLY